jgi:hypothetical protein
MHTCEMRKQVDSLFRTSNVASFARTQCPTHTHMSPSLHSASSMRVLLSRSHVQKQQNMQKRPVHKVLEGFSAAGMKLTTSLCSKALGAAVRAESPFVPASHTWAASVCDAQDVDDVLGFIKSKGQCIEDYAAEMVAGLCFSQTRNGLEADLSVATDILENLRALGPGRARRTAMALLKCCVRSTVPDSDCSERGRQARQVGSRRTCPSCRTCAIAAGSD